MQAHIIFVSCIIIFPLWALHVLEGTNSLYESPLRQNLPGKDIIHLELRKTKPVNILLP